MITSLFQTQIFQKRLLTRRSRLFKDIQEETELIRGFDEEGLEWSKQNYPGGFTSYSSRNDLHYMSSTFRALEEKMRPAVLEYASTLGYQMSGIGIAISDMWLNIMGPGCVHTGHIHPNAFISGTYYASIPKGASAIRFEDPRLAMHMAAPPKREALELSQKQFVSLTPSAGELILFESWLRHEVPPNLSSEERVSVSFNYHWYELEQDDADDFIG